MEKETPNDHTLPDCLFKCEKHSVARSREENDFPNNHDQQNGRIADISNNTSQTFTNDNDIYLVEQV